MASRVLLVLVLVLVLADGHAAGGGGARGRKAGKHGARAKRGGAPAAAYGGGSTGRAEPADWAGPSAAVLAAVAELGLERCDFERFENGPAAVVAAAGDKRLSEEEFEARFLRRAPVVVTGLTDGWPGRDGWERAALLATHGAEEVGRGHWRHRLLAGAVPGWQRPISLSLSPRTALSQPPPSSARVQVMHAEASDVAQFGPKEKGAKGIASTLAGWVGRHMSADSDSTGAESSKPQNIVFDRSTANLAYTLRDAGEFSPPPLLASTLATQLLLSLGPSGAGLPMHTHGDSWLALTHGLKLWFVYPPAGPAGQPCPPHTATPRGCSVSVCEGYCTAMFTVQILTAPCTAWIVWLVFAADPEVYKQLVLPPAASFFLGSPPRLANISAADRPMVCLQARFARLSQPTARVSPPPTPHHARRLTDFWHVPVYVWVCAGVCGCVLCCAL